MNQPIKTYVLFLLAIGCLIGGFRSADPAALPLWYSAGIFAVLLMFQSMSAGSSSEKG